MPFILSLLSGAGACWHYCQCPPALPPIIAPSAQASLRLGLIWGIRVKVIWLGQTRSGQMVRSGQTKSWPCTCHHQHLACRPPEAALMCGQCLVAGSNQGIPCWPGRELFVAPSDGVKIAVMQSTAGQAVRPVMAIVVINGQWSMVTRLVMPFTRSWQS